MAEIPGAPVVINNPPGPDPATHNAEIAARLAAQDAAGHSTAPKPGEFEDASTALDKLVQSATPAADEAAKKAAADAEAAKVAAEAAEKKAAEETPEAKKAAADAAAAAEATKKAEEAAAAQALQNVPDLPPETSVKAKDAFSALKSQALKDISERELKIAELNKQLTEAKEAAARPTPEQLAKDKELETLRTHLAKIDVEFDPKFKEFDGKVKQIEDYVFAELKKNPVVTDDIITEIKKFGGLANVNLGKLFEAMKDPATQRIVESKIADVRMLQYQKEQTLKSTKDNVTQYMQERQKAFADAVEGHTKQTEAHLNQFLGALDWMKEKTADTNAKPEDAAAVKAHNDMVGIIKRDVADAMRDDSPQMRATLLTGYANMVRLQNVTTTQAAQIETLTKELTAATTKLAAIKNSATSRLRESGAPASGALPKPPTANQFTTPAADALDRIARQVAEERQAKGV